MPRTKETLAERQARKKKEDLIKLVKFGEKLKKEREKEDG